MRRVAVLLAAVAILVFGCAGAPIIYKDASGENAVTLIIKGQGNSITVFDGESVDWKVINGSSLKVIVLAGSHDFLMVGAFGEEELSLDMSPGKEYEITSTPGVKPSIKRVEKGSTGGSNRVWVNGYRRKDGTYVKGYYRKK
jgi:hypothetical protein